MEYVQKVSVKKMNCSRVFNLVMLGSTTFSATNISMHPFCMHTLWCNPSFWRFWTFCWLSKCSRRLKAISPFEADYFWIYVICDFILSAIRFVSFIIPMTSNAVTLHLNFTMLTIRQQAFGYEFHLRNCTFTISTVSLLLKGI